MEATTKDGKRVLLHADGRWEYEQEGNTKRDGQKAFRNTSWGDSKLVVRNCENSIFQDEDPNTLWYSGQIGGHPCVILYLFVEDKLVRAKYILQEDHSNLNRHIDSFFDIKSNLEKKYGKATTDDVVWHNDLYQKDQQEWGFAISLGHLTCYSEWNAGETLVNIAMDGENHSVMVSVEYISKALVHLEQAMIEQSVLADL